MQSDQENRRRLLPWVESIIPPFQPLDTPGDAIAANCSSESIESDYPRSYNPAPPLRYHLNAQSSAVLLRRSQSEAGVTGSNPRQHAPLEGLAGLNCTGVYTCLFACSGVHGCASQRCMLFPQDEAARVDGPNRPIEVTAYLGPIGSI